ncbi:unnamed protein product [Urochloa humidicola]
MADAKSLLLRFTEWRNADRVQIACARVVSPLRHHGAGKWACSPTIEVGSATVAAHDRLLDAVSCPCAPLSLSPSPAVALAAASYSISRPFPPSSPPTPPRGHRLRLHLVASPVTAAASKPRPPEPHLCHLLPCRHPEGAGRSRRG